MGGATLRARDDDGEKGVDLAADLGNILNDPAFGDVVLVTHDHHRVFASTSILAARCKFFHSMLMNGTTLETRSSEISLPSITISGLLPSLEFIYTGRLSKHRLTIDNVIDVFHASRFFLLTHLHQLSLSFFSSQSSDQLRPYRARLLSRAVEILSPTSDTGIFGQLFSVMDDAPRDTDNVGEFSCEALQLYLKQTRDAGTGISTVEYLRLRFVLIWCAHSISVEAEEALKKYMPAQLLLSASFEQKVLLKVLNPFESQLKASFEPWLHYLDLFQVHPHVLARVVEPMGIMSPIHLFDVYRFQAMFPNGVCPLRWKEGAHPPSYVIQEGGCVLECTVDEKLSGFAMAEELITSSTGVYEWDIVVERRGSNIGIGFCSEDAQKDVGWSSTMWLGNGSHEWALWPDGHLYHNGMKKENYAQHVGNALRVRVCVDMSEGTCSFRVNERECGVAWKEIPTKIYPAVSLFFPGRVRIEDPLKKDKLRWRKPFK